MFYKHFEKFAVALTAFFWTSCGDPISVAGNEGGQSPEYSSSSNPDTGSPSAESSSNIPNTDSSTVKSSSSNPRDELRMSSTPVYGVQYVESSSSVIRMSSTPVYGAPVPHITSSSSSSNPRTDSLISETSSSALRMSSTLYGVPRVKSSSSSSELRMSSTAYGCLTCYNTTAQNADGKEFNIIECVNGQKYLRSPDDAVAENVKLPDSVNVFFPNALVSCRCDTRQEVCIERNPNVENDSLAGCHPVANCPEKHE